MSDVVGTVTALRRFPVKSMQGEPLESAPVGVGGVLGDRAFAVVDGGSGEVVRGKTPELGPRLLACRASFLEAPAASGPLPPVVIELPDGTAVRSDSGDADDVLTRYFDRPMRLISAAPQASSFVTGRSAFLAATGLPALVDNGSLLDASPLSVVTTSTLDRLGAARPETRFDHRRFRMNVMVATSTPGFLENAWPGRCLSLGEAVRLRVEMPTPRCSLTTMAQEDLPRDPAVLRTAARENSFEIAGKKYACVGVYAVVDSPGEIRPGDCVSLEGPLEPPREEAV